MGVIIFGGVVLLVFVNNHALLAITFYSFEVGSPNSYIDTSLQSQRVNELSVKMSCRLTPITSSFPHLDKQGRIYGGG